MYNWVDNVILRFKYFSLKKKDKGIVLDYIEKITGRSRPQIKRLIKQKKKFGNIKVKETNRNKFNTIYIPSDIALLINTDNAHGRLSGPATKRILQREYLEFNKLEYERICHISVPHIYNIRNTSRQYKSQALYMTHTLAVARNIAERKKPKPFGKPGYIRVDSVHQGDKDKEKGVYHINMVDEVTQWEILGSVEGISEYYLSPILEEMIKMFPFKVLSFHSDNGSEYINYQVSRMLNKMMIEQTKSRSRRTNDNALVEGKNGAIVRKHMGYFHIQKKYAKDVNRFYKDFMNEYLNFHRPCGFAKDYVNEKGKIKKKYEEYFTPYEKLKSLQNYEQYLTCSKEELNRISLSQSDNESAFKMQKEKSKLFKKFTL